MKRVSIQEQRCDGFGYSQVRVPWPNASGILELDRNGRFWWKLERAVSFEVSLARA